MMKKLAVLLFAAQGLLSGCAVDAPDDEVAQLTSTLSDEQLRALEA